jgi:site-specific DNA-methyltransferase (adenine-specific)/modification methylase
MYPYGGKKRAAAIGGSKPYGSKKGRVVSDSLVKANEYSPVIGDDKPFDPTFLLLLSENQIIFGANYFASKLPDGKAWIAWDKDVSGNFSQVELAWTSYEGRLRLYRHMWSGLRREGSRDEELTKRVHPTQKPVGLFTQILQDFKGNVILDPFLGSGSTLIACEKLGRKCYGIEIDPHYCSVILARWEAFTGRKAELIES